MTKPAHTTPPPDAAARRRAPPVLTYLVGQLPSFDAVFFNRARAELSKVTELTVPPRDAKAFEVAAGHFFRIVSVEGPQVGDLNLLERARPDRALLQWEDAGSACDTSKHWSPTLEHVPEAASDGHHHP